MKHQARLTALRAAEGKGDGSFEQAVTSAFAPVLAHLERLNAIGGPDEELHLHPGESATLAIGLCRNRLLESAEDARHKGLGILR
jgi:hypothetical protein